MNFDIRRADLRVLNSLTKYPSIPTYHRLNSQNGTLTEETLPFTGTVMGTEKIDGTNARVICTPDGRFLLGSRENLLYADGDLIGDPAQGIVEALKWFSAGLRDCPLDTLRVFYLELYGGRVTAASKNYTGSQAVGWRLFDVMELEDFEAHLEKTPEQIAAWRDNGGQPFVSEDILAHLSTLFGIYVTPRLFRVDASELPTSLEAMYQFMTTILPQSRAALDEDGQGDAEGIVLRTLDRSVIAKARFEDYARTFKRGQRR